MFGAQSLGLPGAQVRDGHTKDDCTSSVNSSSSDRSNNDNNRSNRKCNDNKNLHDNFALTVTKVIITSQVAIVITISQDQTRQGNTASS